MNRENTISGKLMRRMALIYSGVFLLCIITFSVMSNRILHITQTNAQLTLGRIRTEYSSVFDEMESIVNGLSSMQEFGGTLRQMRTGDAERANARLQLYLSSYKQTNANIVMIAVEDCTGERTTSSYYLRDAYLDYLDRSEEYALLSHQKTIYLSPIHYPQAELSAEVTSTAFPHADPYPFVSFSKYVRIWNQPYIITVFYRATDFLRRVQATSGDVFDGLEVLDIRQERLYTTLSEAERARIDANKASLYAGAWFRIGGEMVSVDDLSDRGGLLLGTMTFQRIFSGIRTYLLILLLTLFAPPALLLIATRHVSTRSLAYVRELSDTIEAFSVGDLPPSVIHSGDEVETLSRAFHDLSENVNRQSSELIQKELNTAGDRFRLLTTQLDSHFVSNTMTIINIMARNGKTEDIQRINNALIRILRDRLNTSRDIFGTVKGEVEILKQYMLIISYRYASNVSVSYDVSPEAADRLILKNILQLLVENSLFHGLLKGDDSLEGSISVECYIADGMIVIEESDDGAGISPERLNLLRERHFLLEEPGRNAHIGLRNIYERLELIYRDRFSMDLYSAPGEGTTVVLQMPEGELSLVPEALAGKALSRE